MLEPSAERIAFDVNKQTPICTTLLSGRKHQLSRLVRHRRPFVSSMWIFCVLRSTSTPRNSAQTKRHVDVGTASKTRELTQTRERACASRTYAGGELLERREARGPGDARSLVRRRRPLSANQVRTPCRATRPRVGIATTQCRAWQPRNRWPWPPSTQPIQIVQTDLFSFELGNF